MILDSLFRLILFRRKWRKLNRHNRTSVKRCFDITKVEVGKGTYGSLMIYDYSDVKEHLIIGNYVSIAGDVIFILGGNHHLNRISTYPFEAFYWEMKDTALSKGKIIIGDDVWIGTGAIILSGVEIGQGAVIGAGSVVTNNIPPYAIAVGNPCKIVKYRFSDSLIKELLKLDYSKIDDVFIKDNKASLVQEASQDLVIKLIGALRDD